MVRGRRIQDGEIESIPKNDSEHERNGAEKTDGIEDRIMMPGRES